MPPEDADLCLRIDFKKGEGNPRRIFDAASLLIEGFEKFDDLAVASIDSHIEPILVLEDVEAGSLKIWLKNILRATDDQALKELDWKPAVGKYLVRAKYIALKWLDTGTDNSPATLKSLVDDLRSIAEETDTRHFPDYAPIPENKLLGVLDKLQDAKKHLVPGDRLTIETEDHEFYEMDLSRTWSPTASIDPASARETVSHGEMILTIRRPDMIGDTMWQFKHGANNVSAPISDRAWIDRYHDREIDIRPGDALRCYVKFTYTYTADGTLEAQRTEVEKIYEVIQLPRRGSGFNFDS